MKDKTCDSKDNTNLNFSAYLKGGVVKEERFDSEDYCELVYKIHRPGLKKETISNIKCE